MMTVPSTIVRVGGLMSRRFSALLVVLASFAVLPAARADTTGTIEGFGGWHNVQVSQTTAGGTTSASGQGTALVGGGAMVRLSGIGIGFTVDKTVSGSYKPWAGAVQLGLLFDPLPSLRLDALGEFGRYGADFGDMFNSNGQWFLGLRPGVSFRLLPSPIRLGIAVPIRWATSGGSFGSPDWGFVGRVGFEFP